MISFIDDSGEFNVQVGITIHTIFWQVSRPDDCGDRVIRFALAREHLDDLPSGSVLDLPSRVATAALSSHIKYRIWNETDGFPSQPSKRTADGRRFQRHIGANAERLCDYTRFANLKQMARYLVDGTIPEEADALRQ